MILNQGIRLRFEVCTHNWGGLTTLPSIFLSLIYLFICLNVSVYIKIIYKWSKTRAWYAFWLSINEMQPWKFIGKNRKHMFLDSALFFQFPWSRGVWNKFIKSIAYIQFTFISHSLCRKIRMRLGNALVVSDLYGLFLHSWYF